MSYTDKIYEVDVEKEDDGTSSYDPVNSHLLGLLPPNNPVTLHMLKSMETLRNLASA